MWASSVCNWGKISLVLVSKTLILISFSKARKTTKIRLREIKGHYKTSWGMIWCEGFSNDDITTVQSCATDCALRAQRPDRPSIPGACRSTLRDTDGPDPLSWWGLRIWAVAHYRRYQWFRRSGLTKHQVETRASVEEQRIFRVEKNKQ